MNSDINFHNEVYVNYKVQSISISLFLSDTVFVLHLTNVLHAKRPGSVQKSF